MAWFGFGKSQKPEAATAPQPPASAPDFDQLVVEAKRGGNDAMNRLWQAVFGLKHWHFIARGQFPETVTPFCADFDGRPMACAFTDEAKAHAYAVARGLNIGVVDNASPTFAVLSTERDAAISTLLSIGKQGLWGMNVNDGPNGFFCPLTNLVPMHSYHTGTPLAESAQLFGLDPVPVLAQRALQTKQEEHTNEFFRACFALEQLRVPLDGEGKPILVRMQDGRVGIPVFSRDDTLADCADDLRAANPKLERVRTMPMSAAIEFLKTCAEAGVHIAIVNMTIPIRLNEIEAMRDSYRS